MNHGTITDHTDLEFQKVVQSSRDCGCTVLTSDFDGDEQYLDDVENFAADLKVLM
jgi:hypothetical protein